MECFLGELSHVKKRNEEILRDSDDESRTGDEIKIELKALDVLKSKQKSVGSIFFRYVKICIFRKCIQNTIVEKKINGTKNALLFLSQAPTYHNFIFIQFCSQTFDF